jgi:threonine 3-dehydrogenase
MKALSKLKAEEGIWMTDVPEPEVGHNDLLIKIRKTACCALFRSGKYNGWGATTR